MSLDDKLKEIVWGIGDFEPTNANEQYEAKFIAQIKQAFEDEGYIQIAPTSKYHIQEANKGKMTGQEWYDRFMDNYEATIEEFIKFPDGSVTHIMVTEGTIKSAQKAAGL